MLGGVWERDMDEGMLNGFSDVFGGLEITLSKIMREECGKALGEGEEMGDGGGIGDEMTKGENEEQDGEKVL
jgi:hypothetical protein